MQSGITKIEVGNSFRRDIADKLAEGLEIKELGDFDGKGIRIEFNTEMEESVIPTIIGIANENKIGTQNITLVVPRLLLTTPINDSARFRGMKFEAK